MVLAQLVASSVCKWLKLLPIRPNGGRWSSFPLPQRWDVRRLHVEWLERYIKSHVQHGFLGLDGVDTQRTDVENVEKPKDVIFDTCLIMFV